ncbi:VQ motif-containing protein 22-like [Nymphaea colorata]|uniref:VQ motif-containing protein 22-like n=1 Tax=Nymphaea colorata TaxID=210225 RepID=UPI00129D5C1F|nr:VQ motif-containing protein 22-like [Nymphaea colorata]
MERKSEWMEFYHRNLGLGRAPGAPVQPPLSARVSDAMAVTTTMTMPDLASPQRSAVPAGSSVASANSGAALNANSHLGAEGRVAKAPRKRTRVSKRAPTTLLNTDTHNFRAMVQQFTGGPSAHLFTGYQTGGSNLNFGYGPHHHQMNNPLAAAPVPLAQPSLQQHQEELVFFSSGDSGNVAAAAVASGSNNGGNQVFLQGFTNSRPNPDGFLFDGVSSNMQPRGTSFQRW